MNMRHLTPPVAFPVFTAVMLFTAPAFAATAKAPSSNPDFTKGGVIPADAKHDWTLVAGVAIGMEADAFDAGLSAGPPKVG